MRVFNEVSEVTVVFLKGPMGQHPEFHLVHWRFHPSGSVRVVMQGPVRSGLLTLFGQDRDRDRDRTDPIFQDRDRTKRLLGPD
ncbi:hypothetical protein OH76DRAFT_1412038 [Lentinus brumalis]|uniref:Uncharacterized protein n=1 Tax=Lentinus brumalis TaxID=2498619 RepID=A0A371CMR4_9APHY|nr:hypothetical protein OH76DRAFT_1412038 [Polyporus brumalis]